MNRSTRHEKKLSPHREAGFTLVEVLISIVILVFGLVAVTNLFLVAGSSNMAANAGSAATAIASQQMEVLKALPFSDPQLAAGGLADPNPANAVAGYRLLAVQIPGAAGRNG
jgi:prepilin-type N-terminal cleavage/methylation domain-containing protein